jgi:hypothetical protein
LKTLVFPRLVKVLSEGPGKWTNPVASPFAIVDRHKHRAMMETVLAVMARLTRHSFCGAAIEPFRCWAHRLALMNLPRDFSV